jgi:hypothetical protein
MAQRGLFTRRISLALAHLPGTKTQRGDGRAVRKPNLP